MWEQKTGTYMLPQIDCSGGTCSDPHEVRNMYAWSSSGTAPDGAVYTDFLERVNGTNPLTGACTLITCTGLGGHTDWRIPSVAELQSILAEPHICTVAFPCIDSIFVDPPTFDTAPFFYWSATTKASVPRNAWFVTFDLGNVNSTTKTANGFVRAVRGGS